MTPDRYTLLYDGSFDGLLSAVFAVYAGKYPPDCVRLTANPQDADLFGHTVSVASRADHAARVLARLQRQLGRRGIQTLIYGFLSAAPDMPDTFLRIVRLALAQPQRRNILSDYGHPDIMQWAQWVKSVGIEKHRMEAFVRFEAYRAEGTEHDVYAARIAPVFDVLPLVVPFFRRRYADQHWAVIDSGRGYGVYYDLKGLHPVSGLDLSNGAALSGGEQHYQALWRQYFDSTNIRSRRNPGLQRRQMPQRYWAYLTEKQPCADRAG